MERQCRIGSSAAAVDRWSEMKGNRGRNAETQRRRDGDKSGVRAFIAIEIPEDVIGAIVSDRRKLERRLPKARWVAKENQHLTQARLVQPWRAGPVQEFLDWGATLRLPSFQAQEVVVFTSELPPAGPVYTVFERIRLA